MAEDAPDIESQVQNAMRARVTHFKEQADSLTFEGVRRLLEKDLGLETYVLDVHKRFIKQCLLECMAYADDDNASKNSGESVEQSVSKTREEAAESPEGVQVKKNVKESISEDDKMEDSPVLGLMTGKKTSKHETKEIQSSEDKVPSETTIKKAVRRRASYVRANSDKVTMADLRRLLEKDLGLDKCTLDPYKKLISKQLDKALNSAEGSESSTGSEKKNVKIDSHGKSSSRKGSSEGSSDSSGSESEEVEEEVKPKKNSVPKEKTQKSEQPKKRKKPVTESKVSSTKRVKPAERKKENCAAEDSENGDDNSQSSAGKPAQKKEVSTPAYGKRVEHLKSVIKSCGMSVPPVIYKKVKQVPENKREASLIKELEAILSKEGLFANPSEKEIKEVRKRKERARELEGIDTSNIVSSSRRRSTTSFVATPKPKIPVESDDSESSDDDDDNEDNDDDDEDEGDDDVNGDSQSEEPDEDNDEDSD